MSSSVDVVETIHEMRQRRRIQGINQVVGVVPTMGDLHAGHLRLVDYCRDQCSFTIATLFVNPLQFGPKEDFADYPRALAHDRAELEQRNVNLLFAPSIEEMYPDGQSAHTIVSCTRPERTALWRRTTRSFQRSDDRSLQVISDYTTLISRIWGKKTGNS